MTGEGKNLIYLLACAVSGIVPKSTAMPELDIHQLFLLAAKHNVSAAVAVALESMGVHDVEFHKALGKAIYNDILFKQERSDILAELERECIWHMPLKGILLRNLYPASYMREMVDNDIIIDENRRSDLRRIMLARGYKAVSFNRSNHDIYQKKPIFEFEMHVSLFMLYIADAPYRYFADVQRLLKKDEGNDYGYHFSDEDFYLYMTVHEYKHYSSTGTGLKALMDSYVFLKAKSGTLDWNYVNDRLREFGLTDFEARRRDLADRLFSFSDINALPDDEREMLEYYISSGSSGTRKNLVENNLRGRSKLSFWLNYIFIPRKMLAVSVPFTRKSVLLYPIGLVWRGIRGLLFNRRVLMQTIKIVWKYGE